MNAATITIPKISPTTGDEVPALESLSIYYDAGRFWVKTRTGSYVIMNETSVRRELRSMGIDTHPRRGGGLSDVEAALQFIQHEKQVDYVGPLAGQRRGLHTEAGRRLLVTEECNLPTPKSGGQYPTIKALVEEMLDSDGIKQSTYFLGWLKRSFMSLESGELNPGQVIVFAGPRDSGKTLLQSIVCTILGGAAPANPYPFMTSKTPFNSDLFRAENLMFETRSRPGPISSPVGRSGQPSSN